MKSLVAFFGLLLLTLLPALLPAEEAASLDWDIDSIFDEPPPEVPDAEIAGSVQGLIKQRGFTFDASFEFAAGIAPGWYEAPWFPDEYDGFYFGRAVKMRSTLSLDARISSVFRVKSTVYFTVPEFSFYLGDFFFDYILLDTVFFRGGKYNLSWGISPNYNFTNLLARIPSDSYSNDSFIFKADIPIGIGGFQILAMTRADLLNGASLGISDMGFGGKFNIALRQFDMDLGVFYQDGMALRSFLSLKTSLWNTELYSEGMLAIDVRDSSGIGGAANLGFARSFFNDRFTINGEIFYNAEESAYWYSPESSLQDAETSSFIGGLNLALNLLYRFEGKLNPRLFIQARYAPMEYTAQLVPGFRLAPSPHIELYCAVPMALGSRDRFYYTNTVTKDTDSNRPIPFSVVLLLTLKGGVQFGHYY